MSERDGYEPGVPCWVTTVHPNPEKAVGFYTELFSWSREHRCQLRTAAGRCPRCPAPEHDGVSYRDAHSLLRQL
jgi:predicted enzyme related to lactoylglutathione lyase